MNEHLSDLAQKFDAYVLDGVDHLRARGYHPTLFLATVAQCGSVVATTKLLLADPRRTSYGFEKLWEMKELDRSVEFAVCLPWFRRLFDDDEVDEARRRLILHDFPLMQRLAVESAHPPAWYHGE
jgi:hypothetical protein